MFHRRTFLKTTVAALASLILPRNLLAGTPDHSFHFIHTDTLDSWPVANPVAWSLENARQPVLKRATEGLLMLKPSDGDRIVRLVVRRCRLNLIELRPENGIVQHWGQHGLADLRPFFKAHRLARPEIEVVVRDRKKEIITTQPGDDFLYGDQIAPDFPLDLFQSKWTNRFTKEADDGRAAPGTSSGFAWDGVEGGRIPWAAMKSAWRRAVPMVCLNCDGETILVNFGLPWSGVLSRTPRFVHVCGTCRRSFKYETVDDVAAWMAANLDADVLPEFEMVWGRRVERMQS